MRVSVVFAVLAAFTAGCGLMRQAEIDAQNAEREKLATSYRTVYDARRLECEKLAPTKERPLLAPLKRCTTSAYNEFVASLATIYPRVIHLDLAQLSSAQIVLAASRFDQGQITLEQYEVEYARIEAEYQAALSQRDTSNRVASAAERQANAAEDQAYAAQRQANAANRAVRCTETFGVVTCQ